MAGLRRLAGRWARGEVVLHGPGPGEPRASGCGQPGPSIQVDLRDPRAARAFLLRGSEGLAESYIAGWWDTDDLTGLIRLLIDHLQGPMGLLDDVARRAARPVGLGAPGRRPSPAADRRNVAAHYDLPGQLFALMLDETMSYSCAVFEPPGATLAEAQRAKLDRLCAKLALGPDDHLVEIGTGWGGLAIHAATHTGCRVTTTTLSEAQREVATRRVHDAGLADRVTVLGRDYRELEGTYDKLVSVEMIEAVDWRLYPTFFGTCRRLLRPDGLMALQAITIADRSFERATLHEDFARAMVFPGGCLPSVTALLEAVTDAERPGAGRPGGHRTALPDDAAPVVGKRRCPVGPPGRRRLRRGVPASVALLPGLLRSGVPGATDQRRADGPGRPPVAARRAGGDRSGGTADHRSGSRLPAPGSRLPAPGSRLPAPGSRHDRRPAGRAWRLGVPFVLLHLSGLLAVVVGRSPVAVTVAAPRVTGPTTVARRTGRRDGATS